MTTSDPTCWSVTCDSEQQLSYRKQIACHLRTQYVDGINITP